MFDGVYHLTDGSLVFQPVPAPTVEQLQTLLTRIITQLLKILTRHNALMEEDIEIPYRTTPITIPSWRRYMLQAAPTALLLAPEWG